MSIFDSLPSPEERLKTTMLRELQQRRAAEHGAGTWASYIYVGGADLVLCHGTFRLGRRRPEQYDHLAGPMSNCFENALLAAEADPALTYVEGYCTAGHSTPILHGWCEDADGVVELTLPCNETGPDRYIAFETNMAYLPPERWSYMGVRFTTELVREHGDSLGTPLLSYGLPEMAERRRAGFDDTTGMHDWPLLKVPYDPARRVLP